MIIIDSGRCTGCGACVEHCLQDAIRLVDGLAGIDQSKCATCGACLDACPEQAISSVDEPEIEAQSAAVGVHGQQTLAPHQGLAVLPWLGAALTFAAREVFPRLLDVALDAWDRRSAASVVPERGRVSPSPTSPPVARQPGTGRQRRFRNRGGR
jgi:NAD-dependent dihydropyrimidine dehydrogenase PreA subunit